MFGALGVNFGIFIGRKVYCGFKRKLYGLDLWPCILWFLIPPGAFFLGFIGGFLMASFGTFSLREKDLTRGARMIPFKFPSILHARKTIICWYRDHILECIHEVARYRETAGYQCQRCRGIKYGSHYSWHPPVGFIGTNK